MVTEKEFYSMCEKLEGAELPTGLGTYYPTVEQLEEGLEGIAVEEMLPILLFYAADPFKNEIDDDEYKETVKFTRKISGAIPLE